MPEHTSRREQTSRREVLRLAAVGGTVALTGALSPAARAATSPPCDSDEAADQAADRIAGSNHAVGFHTSGSLLTTEVQTRPDSLYGVTKVFGEALGSFYTDRYGMDVAAVRIGSCFDRPPGERGLATWLSPGDAVRLVDALLRAPSFGFQVLYGISANTRAWWDLAPAIASGYRPEEVSGANAGIEGVQNSSGHQGTVDGRGDTAILGTSTTWWQLADRAKSQNKDQQNPRLIEADSSNNFTMYHVNLVDSPNFHVVYKGGNGFTAWGVRIKTPADARNTDGIDPSGATNVTIADSFIQDGDDGIAVKGGSPASNMTIRNDDFWGTHGISIGSETNGGVKNILFENDTLNGVDSSGITSSSDNGIRIKSSASNGGMVTQVTYSNICLSGMKAPIVLDTHYSSGGGSSIPSFTDIVIDGVLAKSSSSSATSVLNGYDPSHPLGVTLENVHLDVSKSTAEYAAVQTYNSTLTPSGTGVTVTAISGSGSVPSCSFPSYPAL